MGGPGCRVSSFGRKIFPPGGPSPGVKTTSGPAATRSVRRDAVASIRRRWAAASADSPAGSSALPPIATTSFVILSPRWKSRAILQNLFERSATGIRFRNGVLHGAGITIYQEGRIASFCESRDVLGTAMEPPLAVPQDGLVPGHVPRPPRDHRLVPARLYGGQARPAGCFFFAPPRGSRPPPPLRASGLAVGPPPPPPGPPSRPPRPRRARPRPPLPPPPPQHE